MTGTDFGLGAIAKLAIVGIVAIVLAILASPFIAWWIWTHLDISWR